ncbi:MAG: LysR family transcriptional regulator [Lachnospiraceae bacterium]|nr:LysR family transcriptional regulator [Lachnospiraceae bacterium]
MELKQLEAFVSVAETGSFSAAARRMYLTQPTVSTHIATLEKELNIRLFQRTTKTLSLTEDGRKLFRMASRMLEIKSAMLEYSNEAGENTICVGASTIPSGYLLPSVNEQFIKKHKGCRIVMKYGNSREIEEMVCDGTVSFGVIGKKSERTELISQHLCNDELVIATPAGPRFEKLIRSKGSREKILTGLLKNPVILREDGSGTRYASEKLLEESGSANIVMRSNDQEAIKQMVSCGAGVSIMSAYAAADMARSGRILTFPIEDEAPRSFYIVLRKDVQLKAAENEYIETAQRIYDKARTI